MFAVFAEDREMPFGRHSDPDAIMTIDGNAFGVTEQSFAGGPDEFAVFVELLDATVAAVEYPYVAFGVDRQCDGIKQLPVARAFVPELPEGLTGFVELLDAIVTEVEHEEVAAGADGYAPRFFELPV